MGGDGPPDAEDQAPMDGQDSNRLEKWPASVSEDEGKEGSPHTADLQVWEAG